MQEAVTRLDYCQYLLVSQINYTLTHFADHSERFSHDEINRYLGGEKITPRLVWENVKSQVIQTPRGYVLFDDTVLDKRHSFAIDLVRRQYSGNAHGVNQRPRRKRAGYEKRFARKPSACFASMGFRPKGQGIHPL